MMFYVYVHTVPNGKIYVGQTKDLLLRWNNGEGYIQNRPFYKDIQVYGWNNIKHEIVAEYNDRESALQLESVLIAILNAENTEYGYNQTTIYNDAIKKYAARVPIQGASLEKGVSEDSFFEATNLPVSVCTEMINQWIFNEQHRKILKDRLINGMTYTSMSEKYSLSVRHLKNIVYSCCEKLEKHI